jgi:2-methylisocitrate lyase-like PEP mutase family enzyme
MGRAANIGFAGAVAARTTLPVTADLEAGYGADPAAVAETVSQAIAAGLVGCNIEDVLPGTGRLMDFDAAVARIRAGADAARAAGVDFVVNGRTDPYLVRFGDGEANFAEAVRRANAFLEAGAACVYVPGVTDAPTLERLVQAINGPLNAHTIGGRPAPTLAQFRDIGVRRLSLGGSLMMASLRHLRDMLVTIRTGDHGFAENAVGNAEMNRLMAAWSG